MCDSLKPTNLLLLLSAVCQWQEVSAAGDAAKEPKHSAAGEKRLERQEAAPQSAGLKAEAADETGGAGGGGSAGGLSRVPTLGAGGSAPHSAAEPVAEGRSAADEAVGEEQTARVASAAAPSRESESAPPAWKTLTPGALFVEPTSLKALSNGPALLYLKTTGIRAMSFSLPPGYSTRYTRIIRDCSTDSQFTLNCRRHVLSLRLTSPVAYHLQILSASPFTVGDEEVILPLLTKVRANLAKPVMSTAWPAGQNWPFGVFCWALLRKYFCNC